MIFGNAMNQKTRSRELIIWERNEPKKKVLRNDHHWERNEPKKKVLRNDHHWERNEPKKKGLEK